jgi:hypothetical protein
LAKKFLRRLAKLEQNQDVGRRYEKFLLERQIELLKEQNELLMRRIAQLEAAMNAPTNDSTNDSDDT